jgi:AIR synthase-related protein
MLSTLISHLKNALGILHKQDIQTAANRLMQAVHTSTSPVLLGDDCAAIPDGEGYLLLAAEGILPAFVESDPWFAGWCAVMVNVSDIYAMGGRAIAVVDTLWSQSTDATQPLLEGMQAAAQTYGVPIVGGHTNCHSPYNALSVAILGRAQQLISGFNARPGDVLLAAIDMRGKPHSTYGFWNAATAADPTQLRDDLALLPKLAESGLCDAGKDISMGGIVGTTLMLLETSGCGATLNVDAVPRPQEMPLENWLTSFPSYGFLLSVRPSQVPQVQQLFHQRNLVCDAIGTVTAGHTLTLCAEGESLEFWNLLHRPLTGFSTHSLWAEAQP